MIVTILGFGNVGSCLCQMLMTEEESITINILDPLKSYEGKFLDMLHASMINNHELRWNDHDLFRRSDYIFHTAGEKVAAGASRLSVVSSGIEITRKIFEGFVPQENSFIIVIANPVDIITDETFHLTGIERSRVCGIGTMIDSFRFKSYLTSIGKLESGALSTMVVGEHGEGMMYLENYCFYNDTRLTDCVTRSRLDELFARTMNAAAEIKQHEPATIYGISMCAYNLYQYLKKGIEKTLALCVNLNISNSELLNFNGSISVPVRIEDGRIMQIRDVNYTTNELSRFRNMLIGLKRFYRNT